MEVSEQFHTLAALSMGKNLSNDCTGCWLGPRASLMFWRRQNCHACAEIQDPDHPAHSLVTKLTGTIVISVKLNAKQRKTLKNIKWGLPLQVSSLPINHCPVIQ
jgi:hypothetical protein